MDNQLELQSGGNDPMAVFPAVGLLQLLEEPGTAVAGLSPLFLLQMTVGAAVGMAPGPAAVGRQLVDLGLPTGALLLLASRDDEFVVPQGTTVLRAGDNVVVVDSESLRRTREIVEGNGSEP